MLGPDFKVVSYFCGIEDMLSSLGMRGVQSREHDGFLNALLLFVSLRFGSLGAFCVASCPSVGYRLNGSDQATDPSFAIRLS